MQGVIEFKSLGLPDLECIQIGALVPVGSPDPTAIAGQTSSPKVEGA